MPQRRASTTAELLDLLRQSGLVGHNDFAALAHQLPETARGDVREAARWLVAQRWLSAWQVQHLLAGRWKGFFLGRYKLLRLLGTGGMGRVFLAEHTYLKRPVALKLLTDADADSPRLRRFFRESQAVAALNHPHICGVYDFDTDGRFHFLVQEYLEGPDLQQLVEREGPLPIAQAVRYTIQAAQALDHAHRHGMIHRDVKPANLMLNARGELKLLDLGVVRWHRCGDPTLTADQAIQIIGTVDYLPPEQFVDVHNVDARADQYALGCTLYFLLTGRPPFDRGSQQQRIIAHQTQQPPSLSALRPQIPPALAEVVARLMAKQPDERYASAAEVASALEHLALAEPVPAVAAQANVPAATPRLHAIAAPESALDEASHLAAVLTQLAEAVRHGQPVNFDRLLLSQPTNWLSQVFGPVRGARLGREYHERRGLLKARLRDFVFEAAKLPTPSITVTPATTAALRTSNLDASRRAVPLWFAWFTGQDGGRVQCGPFARCGSSYGLLDGQPQAVPALVASSSARKQAV